MEFNRLVSIRRSCRSYTEDIVYEADLREMIKAAQMAPTWKNSQTGRYYAALSDEGIANVFNALPDFNQNSSRNAAYIVTSFVPKISGYGANGVPEKAGDIWGGYDLGLQNAYLILKAADLGYDTLIMGLRDEDALRKYFDIPDEEIIMSIIAVGKRKSEPTLRPRKDVNEILKIK